MDPLVDGSLVRSWTTKTSSYRFPLSPLSTFFDLSSFMVWSYLSAISGISAVQDSYINNSSIRSRVTIVSSLFAELLLLYIALLKTVGLYKVSLKTRHSLRPCSGSIPDNTPCRRTCLLVIDYFCIFERILFFRPPSLESKLTSFSGGIFFNSWFICFCLSGWNSIFRCSRWGLLKRRTTWLLF